jgi:biopolymer transport protein TolQ
MLAQAEQSVPVNATNGAQAAALDPVRLMLESSGVVLVVLMILVTASTLVWLIWLLKAAQLRRLRSELHRFEQQAAEVRSAGALLALAHNQPGSPGARVILELSRRNTQRVPSSEVLLAAAKRAIANEQQRASALMPTLSSIASASPFVGLFGTVWGIMDAFLRIGVEKSASLPVVAPAIGEALIATAFGLVAAIPATIGYNYIDKRIGDLLEELNASTELWAELLADRRDVHDGVPAAQFPPAAAYSPPGGY